MKLASFLPQGATIALTCRHIQFVFGVIVKGLCQDITFPAKNQCF